MNKFFSLLAVILLPVSLLGMENKSAYSDTLRWTLANNLGNTEYIDALLTKGADANACNRAGHTPLRIAANNLFKAYPDLPPYYEHVIESLLEHGAKFEIERTPSDYDLIKLIMPKLDSTIKKAEYKKTTKKLAADLMGAAEQNKTNKSIIINGRPYKFQEEILRLRCSKILELNLPAKPFLHAPFQPLRIRNSNINKIAALNFEADQEID